jgi:hypothetical protein
MSETITAAEHRRREGLLDLAEWVPHTPEPSGLEQVTITGRTIVVRVFSGIRPYSFTYEHRPLDGFEARRAFHFLVRRFGRQPTIYTGMHAMAFRWSRDES